MNLNLLPDSPPTLEFGEYSLRELRQSDASAWYGYLSDPKVTEMTSYDIRSYEAAVKMTEWFVSGYEQQKRCRWAIVIAGSDRLVGTCGFHWWDTQHSVAEMGYDIARECWGQGIMTQAVRKVVRWVFTQLEVNRVQATVMRGNVASRRVLLKCGFQHEGTLRQYRICRGYPCDFDMFSCLREWGRLPDGLSVDTATSR